MKNESKTGSEDEQNLIVFSVGRSPFKATGLMNAILYIFALFLSHSPAIAYIYIYVCFHKKAISDGGIFIVHVSA